MAKSVRYKLNRNVGGKKRRKKESSKKTISAFKKIRNLKPLKILLFLIAFSILSYWLFVAYTTVRDIKITDVVDDESEVVEFAETEDIKRTLIIYEKPNSTEQENLFILAVIYNADTSEALIYHYPSSLYIDDYFAGKYISIQNLTYAGQSYMHKEKYAYVIRQIEEQMAINFDSYILFGSEIGKNFVSNSDNWGYSKEEVLSIFSKLSFVNLMPRYYKVHFFEEYFHSNMNFLQMYSYFQNIQGILSSDNYKYINLSEGDFVKETTLGGGQNVKLLNPHFLDESLEENMDISRTKDLRAEHVKVEVYNGSDIPGYAGAIAREIHNSGCRVIRFENASKPYEKTRIYISDQEKFANGLEVVSSIVENAEIIEGRPEFLTTGDIVVILGLNE